MELKEGTLLQGDGSSVPSTAKAHRQELYVVHGGKLVPVSDKWELYQMNGSPDQIQCIPDGELEKLPKGGKPAQLLPGQTAPIDLDTFLGSGHYMYTQGVLRKTPSGGFIDCSTRTLTVTWFGGYHGAVYVLYIDAGDICIGQSPWHRFGVDGTWIGCSDRTDYWTEVLSEDIASRTVKVLALHTSNPDSVDTILGKAVSYAKSVNQITTELASVAATIWKLFQPT